MPIPITAYRCGFKCGRKAAYSRKAVEQHELKCVKNPDTRSCMTCKNEVYERDTDESGRKRYYRGCKIEVMNQFIDDMYKTLETGMAVSHVKPLAHCPNWNAEECQPGTEQFLNEIRQKMEAAYNHRIGNIPF